MSRAASSCASRLLLPFSRAATCFIDRPFSAGSGAYSATTAKDRSARPRSSSSAVISRLIFVQVAGSFSRACIGAGPPSSTQAGNRILSEELAAV